VSGEVYRGPAVLDVGGDRHDVRVHLAGHVEPVDGRYHWGGRVAPDPAVAGLVRAGARDARLVVGAAPAADVRLTEVDPWGGVVLRATGIPPWDAP